MRKSNNEFIFVNSSHLTAWCGILLSRVELFLLEDWCFDELKAVENDSSMFFGHQVPILIVHLCNKSFSPRVYVFSCQLIGTISNAINWFHSLFSRKNSISLNPSLLLSSKFHWEIFEKFCLNMSRSSI